MLRRVQLTDDELVLLDGACSEKVQAEVDGAKQRITSRSLHPDVAPVLAGFIADVVSEAQTNGEVILRRQRLRRCALCGTAPGYVLFKSGPRRGTPNYKKPRVIEGYEFARRFVTVQHHAALGGCAECLDPILPLIADALRGVNAQIPDRLRAEGEPKRVKHPNRRCTKCGWEGHEGQMGRQRTIMGDGSYPATCPACGAGSEMFSRDIATADGFTIAEVEA